MNLTGQLKYNNATFYYSFVNNRKIVISSATPKKLSVIVKVRKEIQKEIQAKMNITHKIIFDFKTCHRRFIKRTPLITQA